MEKVKLFAWSVPLKVFHEVIDGDIVDWSKQLYTVPVHTFVTVGDDWLEEPGVIPDKTGYWYCAGDFCPSDHKLVVNNYIGEVERDFVYCLVQPDIHRRDEEHGIKVIGGTYAVDYVCHNITNRVIYSYLPEMTLLNRGLPITGYKAVINSYLGVYGRIKREWLSTINACRSRCSPQLGESPNDSIPPVEQDDEISKIHLHAADGDIELGTDLDEKLKAIDLHYRVSTEYVYLRYKRGLISKTAFNKHLLNLHIQVIRQTEMKVGVEMTRKIYGEYNLPPITPDLGFKKRHVKKAFKVVNKSKEYA